MRENFAVFRRYMITVMRVAQTVLNECVLPPQAGHRPHELMEALDAEGPVELELFILTEDEEQWGEDEEAAALLTTVMENYDIEGLEKEVVIRVRRVGKEDMNSHRRRERPTEA